MGMTQREMIQENEPGSKKTWSRATADPRDQEINHCHNKPLMFEGLLFQQPGLAKAKWYTHHLILWKKKQRPKEEGDGG